MSTIVRSSSESRSGRGGRGGSDGSGGSAGRGAPQSQRALSGRVLRARNAWVCHAAVRLGLARPTDAELRELSADATLGEAVEWWRARAPAAVAAVRTGAGVSLVLRTAVIVGVTLVGLAVSYGQAQ